MINLNNEIKTNLKIKLQNLGFLFSIKTQRKPTYFSRGSCQNVYLDDKELLFTVENNKIC